MTRVTMTRLIPTHIADSIHRIAKDTRHVTNTACALDKDSPYTITNMRVNSLAHPSYSVIDRALEDLSW